MKMENKRVIRVLPYVLMTLFMSAVMVGYSGIQEFWYDEVYQLGMVRDGISVKEMLVEYAQLRDYTPPLYAFMCYFWVRLVPFSFRWMLLLPEGLVAAGVFVTSLLGERIGGRRLGILTCIFAITSRVLIVSAGYEFRAYGLYFFASALTCYFLACRIQNSGKKVSLCYFGSLVLLLYSHYYGAVLFGVLFLIEFWFAAVKYVKWRSLAVYAAAGAAFLPWMYMVLICRERSMTEFWIQPPDLMSLIGLFQYLCSDNSFVFALFCLGFSAVVVPLAGLWRKKEFAYERDGIRVYLAGVITGVVLLMYVYGAYINPAGGIFYNRYFIGLLPACFVITAAGFKWLVERIGSDRLRCSGIFAVAAVFLFLLLLSQNGESLFKKISKKQSVSYTGAVHAMSRCEDIESSDVVVVTTDNSWVRAGIEMYFHKLFHTKPVVLSQYDDEFAQRVKEYRKIYLFKGKQALRKETEKELAAYEGGKKLSGQRVYEYEK